MLSLRRNSRLFLLVIGLFVITAVTLALGALSRSIVVVVENDLQNYWRTTYDILVRPAAARSGIEAQYGLVEANYLTQLNGGISYEQFQEIAAIPGVDVAAPIAVLTYVEQNLSFITRFPAIVEPGVYLHEATRSIDDGTGREPERYAIYYFVGPEPTVRVNDPRLFVNQPISPFGQMTYFLLAAIDPLEEAKLVGLDEAVVDGAYLNSDTRVFTETLSGPFGTLTRINDLPVLLNRTPYSSYTLFNRLSRVALPSDVSTLEAIMQSGGVAYLDSLATELLFEREVSSQEAYPRLMAYLSNARAPGRVVSMYSMDAYWQPRTRRYQEVAPPATFDGLVLEATVPEGPATTSAPNSDATFTVKAAGIFDVERIPPPDDVNRVPLEIYRPPRVTQRYDEAGNDVVPHPLRPALGPGSWMLSPPLMLTSMGGARLLTGDNCAHCISAVRVRVADIDALTPENQRKIETIASEIVQRTGLEMDIMVGSSPTVVLVHVPDVGYVEEQWVQKNVTAAYGSRVRSGHLLLMGALLAIGALFVLDLAWADVIAQRRTIALQKAVGWRSSSVFANVLMQIMIVGVVAALIGAVTAAGLIWLFDWTRLPLVWMAGVPLLIIVLSLLGGLYPAWLAAHVPPAAGLRDGTVLGAHSGFAGRVTSVRRYAWHALSRRWRRTALAGLAVLLSSALLVLMLAITVDRQGAMSGTLLGEFILVQLETYHYAIVVAGFALAALSLANSLLASILERRREIGVLKAIGWHTIAVVRLFVTEAVLLGALGGLLGATIGLAAFVTLYKAVSACLFVLWLLGLLIPVMVAALSAIYPAYVAAKAPPARAVRYE